MRKPRFTFKGAFHHVMNRGYNKSVIFPNPEDKAHFVNIMKYRATLLKIDIFAYVVMDNHYHIILQNSSGKLSDFMKQLNSIYATYFRKKYGGVGYVFQDRYKSTLIQNEQYLLTSIIYVLQNPVRAKIVDKVFDYKFSSINEYFNNSKNIKDYVINVRFVEGIFRDRENFIKSVQQGGVEVQDRETKIGKVMGDEGYEDEIIVEAERRKNRKEIKIPHERQRGDEYRYEFPGYNEIIRQFMESRGINGEDELLGNDRESARLRIELLKEIRGRSMIYYREINKIRIYQRYKLESIKAMYNKYKRVQMDIKLV